MDRRQRLPLQLLSSAILLFGAHCQCPQDWRENEGRCYFFAPVKLSWMEANAFCLDQSSNLLSIQDIHERLWVTTQISSDTYWIGLNDGVTEGVWEWSDGSPYIEYLSYWQPGQPDNWGDTGEDCGQVIGSNFGRWNDENCNIKRNYICKFINTNPSPQCDFANGWTSYQSNCYKLKAESTRSWSGARHDCVQEGGDLVSITSPAEEQYITGILDSSLFDLWIGLSTLKCTTFSCEVEAGNSEFTWSDAEDSSFRNWADGEPTLDAQAGSCVTFIKDATDQYGKWRTHVCRYERPYMCKRPLSTICPAGWLSFAGSCYWLVSNLNLLTTWHEALTECNDRGSHLLIIDSQEEQYYINGNLPEFHHVDIPDIWIGLSDKDQDGVFRWVDKTAIVFSNFGPGWPRNTPNLLDCGKIYTGNYDGKWETTNCFKRMGYICEMKGGQNTKPTAAPGSHCDRGYLLYGDFCYHFETESVKKWHDAEAYCNTEHAFLASVHSEEELSFITGHMSAPAWIGLNDIDTENVFVYTDGTPFDFQPWAEGQPGNWPNNEDCVNIRGISDLEAGKFNDDFCTATKEFICKKAKGQGPPPPPPTSGPGWNDKCGFWTPDPFNDFCYLFNYLSMRTWAEAQADCVNQGGNLISITEPFEQGFIQGVIKESPTGVALWMGGHDSITEGGWEWTDGSPFRYIRWSPGNPDNYYGEDCLTMIINTGYWNDDDCHYKRGYICKRRGKTPETPPPHDGFMTALVCQDSTAVLHCPVESVINIQSAFYGRKSDDICPYMHGSEGVHCTVDGVLPYYRRVCDNRAFCFAHAYVEADPCPTVSKYLEIVYSCEQKVCLRGLGVEDGNITDAHLSASSSKGLFTPNNARLNGNSCWMPSGNPTQSWIQANLSQNKKVTGIVIQGCPQNDYWVTKFKLQHSMDGERWTDYGNEEEDSQVFPGSTDRNTPDTQLLGTPVSTQYVRIIPLEFNGQAGLRFDVLGCSPDYAVTCEHRPNFHFAIAKMTVHCPAGCANVNYRVHGTSKYRGDSNTCAAAIHAGVLLNEIGGDCTLLKAEGQNFYYGSTRNGITSQEYDGNYGMSYTFADGELRCSGPDWYEFGEFCYKPFGDKKTWHGAQESCRSLGAELVSILSLTEQSWLESYLYTATGNVWTGLTDLAVPGMFIWSDEHMVTFTHWAPGEPNNHAGFSEDCVQMIQQTGRWNDIACTEFNTYICKTPKRHYPVPSVPPTVYGCPQGWDAYGYACYWMEETAKSWSDAKKICKEKDGFLLHIGDIYEQSHFMVVLSGKTGFWWIGLRAHGLVAGGVDYIWDNGSPLTFTHWDKDQPDSGDGSCVAMITGPIGGFWDDKQCLEEHAFICEKPRPDITPPTKPPTPPLDTGCADGWTAWPHFRYCYKLFHNVDWSMKKSWGTAREDCLARGSDLVSIHNHEDDRFLALFSKDSSKWIGLKHNPTEGGYSWSDGSPLSHTNWGHGEPNNHEGREACVEMVSSSNGTHSWWNDINCDAHQDWICMIAKGKDPILPPITPPPLPAPDCGPNPGWRKSNNTCYYYNDTDIVDFHTARVRCWMENATLVSILHGYEQAFVNSMVGRGKVASAWIGLRRFGIAGGQFKWVDSSPVTFTHWGAGEPNNANGEEMCVRMLRRRGDWNDANCGWVGESGYVCKKFPGDIHSPPPPTQAWQGNCPAGWKLFKNKCFLFKGRNDEKANWNDARGWCKGQGGELAVIDSQYENDFVSSYLKDLELPAWIGLSDLSLENQYGWSDGHSPVLYTNWNENEPNNAGGVEDCVVMSHSPLMSGKWNDDACLKEYSFVCYMKKSSSINPPPPTRNPCPSGYISWYLNCYKMVKEPLAWDAAQKACMEEGGNLASIDVSYDQAFVAGVVLQSTDDAWIGLRRKGNSSYTWTDGWPVLFTQWGPGEPTNFENEGCVSIHGSPKIHGTWNDTRCDTTKPYICKISSESPPPTPAPGDGKCLPSFVPYGRYCYHLSNDQKGVSWPNSKHICQMFGTELASIHSRAEVVFIRSLDTTKHHNIWIGLTRDSHFGWAWTDNTAVSFLNWAPGEPNQSFHPGETALENCVEMYHDGRWNDNDCLQRRGYVCRHRQYYVTSNTSRPVFPTDPTMSATTKPTPPPSTPPGVIAGAVIAAVVIFTLILGLLYYIFKVRGYKLSGLSLPTRTQNHIDVPTFNNPNFSEESDT